MSNPVLTDRASALLPRLTGKAMELIDGAAGPGVDPKAMRRTVLAAAGLDACTFAAKLLGVSVSPTIDINDIAFHQVFAAVEAGALAPAEQRLVDHELPRSKGQASRILRIASVDGLSPAEIRAVLFAAFRNGRSEEGTAGEHLHIGMRRIFERFFKLIDGMQAVANRSGLYKASDIFEPAYRRSAHGARSPTAGLLPNEPGESVVVARNDLQAI